MHGLVHVILKAFVIEQGGPEAWKAILSGCNMEDDSAILDMRQYDDTVTFYMVGVTARFVGVDLETALEVFGSFLVKYVITTGWKKLISSMGRTLAEFLSNINELHYDLERDFRSAQFPSFQVQALEDSFLLTYHSGRFLPTLALGALRGLAEHVFAVRISVTEVSRHLGELTWRITEEGPLPSFSQKSCAPSSSPSKESTTTGGTRGSCGTARGPPSVDFHTMHSALASCCSVKDSAELYQCLQRGLQNPVPARDTNGISPTGFIVHVDAIGLALREADDKERLLLARELMCAVPAERVATEWNTLGKFCEESQFFWFPKTKLTTFFDWSDDVYAEDIKEFPVFFVTHSWDKPEGWDSVMGADVEYADCKATELCLFAKDCAAESFGDHHKWGEVRFWIDKCCIQQDDMQMARRCIELLEEFLQLSSGLVVLFSWSYLTRMWCVFEWACFLVFHDPKDVTLCVDCFYRASTEDMYLEAVRNFKVSNCSCMDPADRELVSSKIATYYEDDEAFERFLKFSIISLLGRALALRGTRSKLGLTRWAAMAKDCGFHKLSVALLKVNPEEWHNAVEGTRQHLGLDIQAGLKVCCDHWFEEHIAPLFDSMRRECVKSMVLARMGKKKQTIWKQQSGDVGKMTTRLSIGGKVSDADFISKFRSHKSMRSHPSAMSAMSSCSCSEEDETGESSPSSLTSRRQRLASLLSSEGVASGEVASGEVCTKRLPSLQSGEGFASGEITSRGVNSKRHPSLPDTEGLASGEITSRGVSGKRLVSL